MYCSVGPARNLYFDPTKTSGTPSLARIHLCQSAKKLFTWRGLQVSVYLAITLSKHHYRYKVSLQQALCKWLFYFFLRKNPPIQQLFRFSDLIFSQDPCCFYKKSLPFGQTRPLFAVLSPGRHALIRYTNLTRVSEKTSRAAQLTFSQATERSDFTSKASRFGEDVPASLHCAGTRKKRLRILSEERLSPR